MLIPDKIDAKVLITGASGFIGSHLRDALLAAGADVIALRRGSSPAPERGRSVVAEYADRRALSRILADEQPDLVLHVAGATKGVSYEDFRRGNVMPTENLLAAVQQAHPQLQRFVLCSSLTSYGPSSAARPHVESDPRRPVEHYGRSKLEAEQAVEAVGAALPWTIVRPAGVYGPRDADFFNLFREVESGRNFFFGNRDRWFSAVYVDDCVRAIVAAARSEATVGRGYFICDGEPVTFGDFQGAIVKASGRRVLELSLPELLMTLAAYGGELLTRLDGKPRLFNHQRVIMAKQEAWTCRHDAARADFGYRPEVPLAEGIAQSYAWYRAQGWL